MVPDDLAQGAQATPPHTRVPALADQAGQLGRAVRAQDALRPAVGRGTQVARGAGAQTRPLPRPHPVAGEGATVVIVTRLSRLR